MAVARRFMVRVPTSDDTVVAWWEAQDNPSVSIRALIREQVELFGFIDSATRPITPRTGGSARVAPLAPLVVHTPPREQFAPLVVLVPQTPAEPVEATPRVADPEPEVSRPRRSLPQAAPVVAAPTPVVEPVATAVPVTVTPVRAPVPATPPAVRPAADPAGQVDMDDIFGHGHSA